MDGRVINMELVHSVSTGPIPNHMYTRLIDRSLVLNHLLQRWIKFVWTCTNLSTKTRLSFNWILGCIFAMLLSYNIHVLKFILYLFEICAKHQRKLNEKYLGYRARCVYTCNLPWRSLKLLRSLWNKKKNLLFYIVCFSLTCKKLLIVNCGLNCSIVQIHDFWSFRTER